MYSIIIDTWLKSEALTVNLLSFKKFFLYVVAAGCRLTKDEKGSWWIHVGTKGAILACSKMKPVHSVFPKKVFMVNSKL